MENHQYFTIESKSSTIGLIFKSVAALFALNILWNKFENSIGQYTLLFWIIVFLIIVFLIYSYITDKSILTIENNILKVENRVGFPKKKEVTTIEINNLKKINFIQNHDIGYGKKIMEAINDKNHHYRVELQFRYYQLVVIQEYINTNLPVKADLIG